MKIKSMLRVTLMAGVILFVLTALVLTVFYFLDLSGRKLQKQQDNFAKSLVEYDRLREDYETLDRELDRLEKMTISVESWLSVLKRRRRLSFVHPPSKVNYIGSIGRALEIYPAAPQITALACEVLVRDSAITPAAKERLRSWTESLISEDYNTLRLSLHVLLGDFSSPQSASVIPTYLSSDGTESVFVNLILLKMLRAEINAASADIQSMFYSIAPSDEALRFVAEFYYDYGDLQRSAEIFTLVGDENSMRRAADALYLAGLHRNARMIWTLLSGIPCERSLYNLATTSLDTDESVLYFEKLLRLETDEVSDSRQYGLIRYSRLLDLNEAVEALEKTRGVNKEGYPFIDLEICRRQSERWQLERQLAEAWMLLDRHEGNEDLYKWTGYLFLFQRSYDEVKVLLRRLDRFGYREDWTDNARAVSFMAEGELDKAQKLFNDISKEKDDWTVFANLASIHETQKSLNRAIDHYNMAMSKDPPAKEAARILIKTARCLTSLNRTREARLALERALELDPGNLTARMELDYKAKF